MIIFTLLAGERGVLGRVLLQQRLLQHIFPNKKVHKGCQTLLLHKSSPLWNRKGTLFSASTNMKGKVWNISTCVPSPTLIWRKMPSLDMIRYDMCISLKIWLKVFWMKSSYIRRFSIIYRDSASKPHRGSIIDWITFRLAGTVALLASTLWLFLWHFKAKDMTIKINLKTQKTKQFIQKSTLWIFGIMTNWCKVKQDIHCKGLCFWGTFPNVL